MTIKRSVAANAFAADDWPLFDRKRSEEVLGQVPAIRAISYVDRDVSSSVRERATRCAESATRDVATVLGSAGASTWLFIADVEWKPPTRVTSYKALWSTLPPAASATLLLGSEVELPSKRGVRFAGIARVPKDRISWALNMVGPSHALFVSRRDLDSKEQVEAIYRAGFPASRGVPQLDIDWMLLAATFCPLGDILLRAGVEHNEREVYVDVFSSPSAFEPAKC